MLYIFQRDILYHPRDDLIEEFPHFTLHNQNENIIVTHINQSQDKAIIYFGGNAESVDYRVDTLSSLFPNRTIYLLNYRGYGKSSGEPTQEGLCSDGLALYDLVSKKHKSISIIGRSLGSGVASFVAERRDIDKLVLVTPFDSITKVAQERFRLYPASILIKDRFNSIDRVENIEAPTLIILAKDDKVVSPKRSQALILAFPQNQIKVATISDVSHNDIVESVIYNQIISDYL
jgi:hypothetical protein